MARPSMVPTLLARTRVGASGRTITNVESAKATSRIEAEDKAAEKAEMTGLMTISGIRRAIWAEESICTSARPFTHQSDTN